MSFATGCPFPEEARRIDPVLLEKQPDPMEAIFSVARNGHTAIRQMLEERAVYAGIALANLVNTLNPDLIFLGGLLDRDYGIFEPVLRETPVLQETVERRPFNGAGIAETIRPATFGESSGPVGALSLAGPSPTSRNVKREMSSHTLTSSRFCTQIVASPPYEIRYTKYVTRRRNQ
ncbi:MAG TPA: ROK family protein [Caldilineaceae bacterium]|nr:ROK family protein [Caldilineaceae bacterium]